MTVVTFGFVLAKAGYFNMDKQKVRRANESDDPTQLSYLI